MKHILTITILAATALLVQADERTIPEKIRDAAGNVIDKTKDAAQDTKDAIVGAARKARSGTRAAWGKTKAFVSDEMPVYREGASATLAGLAREIAELKAQTPSAAPVYFRTRLQALDEQHAHLAMRLSLLSRDQLRDRTSGPRWDFDRCLGDLERAIDQAEEGAEVLSIIALK